jgi:hypothetical protein
MKAYKKSMNSNFSCGFKSLMSFAYKYLNFTDFVFEPLSYSNIFKVSLVQDVS